MCSVIVECLDASSYIVHIFFNSDFKLLFVYPIGDIAIFTLNFMYIIVRQNSVPSLCALIKLLNLLMHLKLMENLDDFFIVIIDVALLACMEVQNIFFSS